MKKGKLIHMHPKHDECEWEKLLAHLVVRVTCAVEGKEIPDPPSINVCDGHIADLADLMSMETSMLVGDLRDRTIGRLPKEQP
jgi:hypothetical protein